MIIGVAKSGIGITVAMARALLAFAGRDQTRPHVSIGVSAEGALCATDGHTLVRFRGAPLAEEWRGLYWSHDEVTMLLKVARAKKLDTIELPSVTREMTFPPVSQVFPTAAGVCSLTTVNPDYLGRMALVADACAASKRSRPGVTLIAGEEMGPSYYVIACGGAVQAEILIMPMRAWSDADEQAVKDMLSPEGASRVAA